MSRIENTFKSLDRTALLTFISAGDPSYETSLSVLKSLPLSGADIIELGMPFTDPMADGETIQAANIRALNNGASMKNTLNMVREFRVKNNTTPIVLMGYMNPVLVYGPEKFARDAGAAGVDGVIIVDLPPEEADELLPHLQAHNIDLIRLVTPTTDMDRLRVILDGSSGFLYYVSITGVTGAAKADTGAVKAHIDQIREHTNLPIAVGFGIRTPDDARAMGVLADGIVVGSAIVSEMAGKTTDKALQDKISTKVQALSEALK